MLSPIAAAVQEIEGGMGGVSNDANFGRCKFATRCVASVNDCSFRPIMEVCGCENTRDSIPFLGLESAVRVFEFKTTFSR